MTINVVVTIYMFINTMDQDNYSEQIIVENDARSMIMGNLSLQEEYFYSVDVSLTFNPEPAKKLFSWNGITYCQ